MSRVIHFEFPSADLAASRRFYENVFGWKLTRFDDAPIDYWLVSTGPKESPGIDGGLGGAANELSGTVNTVDVADLDDTLQKVLANGGQVIAPKDEIPGVGFLAYIREPGGAILGMIQSQTNSRM